jgi:hypothetical protein
MTTATIVSNPRIFTEAPDWVNEACIGLKLRVSHGQEGDCDVLCVFGRFEATVLPDELIALLRTQQPQERSVEASNWIDRNVYWAGGSSFSTTCFDVEIPPAGRFLLEERWEDNSSWKDFFSATVDALQGEPYDSYKVSFKLQEGDNHALVTMTHRTNGKTLKSVFYNEKGFIPIHVISGWGEAEKAYLSAA